jgi:hypothetical protein
MLYVCTCDEGNDDGLGKYIMYGMAYSLCWILSCLGYLLLCTLALEGIDCNVSHSKNNEVKVVSE